MNKKYRITIEKYAQKDIESIYNYICYSLVNKEAAIKLLNKINEKFDSIALFPKSAPLLNNDYVTNKNNGLSKNGKNKTFFRKIDQMLIKWYNISYERKSIRNNKKT